MNSFKAKGVVITGAASGIGEALARNLAAQGARLDEILFGEAPSRIVVTVDPKDLARLEAIAAKHAVPCCALGTVHGDQLVVKYQGADVVDLEIETLSDTWRGAIPAKLGV